MRDLLRFLNMLYEQKIYHRLSKARDDAIMVEISVPGQRWEVEFMRDGSIEIEKFLTTGEVVACKDLNHCKVIEQFFKEFSE